ncbi:TIR domain-containing protein [Novipirellula caenicola]|uniref:TIR domain-containing protein n=1 Tax=Novipirellula caenicola TaxID=1536901 RepID=A0ABP9VNK3_9BACT
MPYLPPLHIHLLFHPDSADGRAVAESLVPKFLAAPAVRGLRVPIFLTPDRRDGLPPRLAPDPAIPNDPDWLDLDAAEHSVVVVIADARMNRRVGGGTGNQWAAFAKELVNRHDPRRHAVLLVSLDDQGVQLDETLSALNFLTFKADQDQQAREEELTFQLAVRALILLRNPGQAPDASNSLAPAPVSFFLSHAKADLDANRKGPVHRVLEEVSTMRIDQWYDAGKIELTEEFTTAIKEGIRKADLVIVFLTDSWAKSSWCRMEAAYAKEVATPILVVDALRDGEPRSFPYGGNAKVVRWPIPDEATLRRCLGENVNQQEIDEQLQTFRPIAARMVLSASILETLTRAHYANLMQGQAREKEIAIDVSPEAVHLAMYPDDSAFLYPDPPLTGEEYNVLSGLRPNATFETPLMRMSQVLHLPEPLTIAVSVSDSEVLARHGLTPWHLRTITDEIHLYLLVAGVRIAYGGKLEPEKLNDPDNFTLRLFQLVTGYRNLARSFGADIKPILNVAPWPLWKNYGEQVLNRFGTIADLEMVPCPELGLSESELKPQSNGFVNPDTIPHQHAWGPAMTAMREKMTQDCFARVVMGGKIEGYKGRYAGLIEEPLLSLRAGKPLFLVGAVGGCTRLVIDLLEQRDRSEMTTETARANVQNYDQLSNIYRQHNQEFKTREELAEEIKSYGRGGLANALHNGLGDDANRELFYCTDPRRIAELILTGLSNLRSSIV